MAKFKEISNGRVWDITNAEHLKHFRANPRFKEIIEKTNKSKVKKTKKETETTTEIAEETEEK